MTIPLVALAVLTVVGGLVNTPLRTGLEHFLEPVYEGIAIQHPPEGLLAFLVLAGVSVLAGVAGIAAAYLTYNRDEELWVEFEESVGPIWGVWEDAYGVDDLYGAMIVAPGRKAAELAAFTFDSRVVDGAVNGVARLTRSIGSSIRAAQTGQVRNYAAFLMVGGLLAIVWLVIGAL
jgi:NADH-quinone oxidoreductase subunit L